MPKGKNWLVEKSNALNAMHSIEGWTAPELRLFLLYLARINARDLSTRYVRFTLDEFRMIVGLTEDTGVIRPPYMRKLTAGLLKKIVTLYDDGRVYHDSKGNHLASYTQFQLFKRCRVEKQNSGEWTIEFDAHDEALPLIFDFKKNYFTYPLECVLRLSSYNQMRLYELLAQYSSVGRLVISIDDLKIRLDIPASDYPRYNNFRDRVLIACQSALAEKTDLSFTFAPHGKRGKGGKILELEFTITKNKNFVRQEILPGWLDAVSDSLSESTQNTPKTPPEPTPIAPEIPFIDDLAEVTNYEFTDAELLVFRSIIERRGIPTDQHAAYLQLKLRQMNASRERNKIKDRFKYLQAILEADVDKHTQPSVAPSSVPTAEEISRLEALLAKQEQQFEQLTLGGI